MAGSQVTYHTSNRAAHAGVSNIRAEQDYDWLAAGVNKAMMDLQAMAAAGPQLD